MDYSSHFSYFPDKEQGNILLQESGYSYEKLGRLFRKIGRREEEDRVLLIDDFLANGAALMGLITLVKEAGAVLVGAGICVEKAFQSGGQRIRDMGIRVESLARIKSMSEENGIEFCE